MRILAVTNIYPSTDFPGSGSFVEQQVKGLREVGHCVDVIFVDRARKGMHAYLSLVGRLRQGVATNEPDIVHAMYGGIMAEIVTRIVRCRPCIVSFCGSDLLGEPLSGRTRRFLSSLGVLASHSAAKRASGIIVKATNLERALPAGINRKKVRVMPSGVDLDLFRPLDREACCAKLRWKANHFHILFPTNGGDPIKRLGLATAAVHLANQTGLNAEIHELKGIVHSEVPVWLNASDVVLLTSFHEGSPNIIKEALACNVPVVSVDVGDAAERISGISGCYIASPEPKDLALKLLLLGSGHPRTNGRDAMRNLSIQSVALQLADFYCEVIASYYTNFPGSFQKDNGPNETMGSVQRGSGVMQTHADFRGDVSSVQQV